MSEASGGTLVLADIKAIDFERFLTMLYAKSVSSLQLAHRANVLAGSTTPQSWPRPRSGSPFSTSRTSGASLPFRPSRRASLIR
jgi:hypothetical protein